MRSVGGRLAHVVIVLLVVSAGTMLMLDLAPGDPAAAVLGDANATPEQLALVREQMGLDRSIPERYGDWLTGIVTGDFGTSFRTRQPVTQSLGERLPVTLEVTVLALGLSLVISVLAAVAAARRPSGLVDRAISAFSSVSISSPAFLTGLLLSYFFAVRIRWFPVSGWTPLTEDPLDNLKHLTLPVITLALYEASIFTRVLRGDLVKTLQSDFMLAAASKGLSTRRLMFKHALRPSSFSLLTLSGLSLGRLLGGSVIVETLFALPGMGQLLVSSIIGKDLVMVQGVVMFVALTYVIVNVLVDAIYGLLDPRVRSASA